MKLIRLEIELDIWDKGRDAEPFHPSFELIVNNHREF